MATDASFEQIAKVTEVDELAKLDIVSVKGWEVLAPKGKYKVGDKVFYIRPDATITRDAVWATEDIRRYLGAKGRVKTIRIRGFWSHGMLVDIDQLPEGATTHDPETLCDWLGIAHYTEPVPQNLACLHNYLPPCIDKSDEENFQNLTPEEQHIGETVLKTLKKDGSSCTIYYDPHQDVFAVCSRNMWLKPECSNNYTEATKPYWERIKRLAVHLDTVVAIRGEVCGNGINSSKTNKDARDALGFFMYGTRFPEYRGMNVAMGRWGSGMHFLDVNNMLEDLGLGRIPTVPILGEDIVSEELFDRYKNAPAEEGEGIVLNGRSFSYKIKSDNYDTKKFK